MLLISLVGYVLFSLYVSEDVKCDLQFGGQGANSELFKNQSGSLIIAGGFAGATNLPRPPASSASEHVRSVLLN